MRQSRVISRIEIRLSFNQPIVDSIVEGIVAKPFRFVRCWDNTIERTVTNLINGAKQINTINY